MKNSVHKVAIYVDDSKDIAKKLTAMRAFARKRHWAITCEFIEQEFGYDALKGVVAAAQLRQHDACIFWDEDRNMPELGPILCAYCER